jgi:hypothetical protein
MMLLGAPGGVEGQIGQRVGDVGEGAVRFSFPTRSDVEICDEGVRMGDQQIWWRSRDGRHDGRNCRFGSAEVELEIRRGLVREVDVVRGLDDRGRDVLDLGEVSANEAARYLLSLAYDGATEDGAEDAIFPAMLADTDEAWWRDLLAIARDGSLGEGVRKNSLFWLGQAAADAASAGLAELALDDDEAQGIRDAAIFAISQRPDGEAVPVLIELARTAEQAETRRTAMFWLAQSKDARVVTFFEEILLRRIR